ncbi:MAG: glycosyltransferase family 4 protein [Oligoflexia bacterium]|nr:glycosyltransferase family 4 protein [Oligoflexia bacterium]
MKKILIVLYYYHPYVSGLSVLAKNLAQNFVINGHQVTVLTTRYDKNLPKEEIINGVNIKRVPVLFSLGKGVFAPTLWIETIRLSLTHDVVNFHLPMADPALATLFIPTRKIVTQYHCDLNLGSGLVNSFIQSISFALMDIILKKSKKIVVLTKDYFSHCKFKKYIDKAVAIYPPIDYKRWVKLSESESESEKYKKINNDSIFKIGFVGRIVEEKGLQYLFQAIPYLIEHFYNCNNFKIIVVGELNKVAGGSIYKSLTPYIERYPQYISFTGHLSDDDLVKFYNEIDLLVLPSIDPLEAFGMVQVEAMLCGTPVVASDMPGVREVIRRTNFGALATPRDAKDLAAKIISLHNLIFNPTSNSISNSTSNQTFKPIIREELLKILNFENEVVKYEKLFFDR